MRVDCQSVMDIGQDAGGIGVRRRGDPMSDPEAYEVIVQPALEIRPWTKQAVALGDFEMTACGKSRLTCELYR